jgi:uncharacterized protein DUF4145
MNVKVSLCENKAPGWTVRLRCPTCRQRSLFDALPAEDILIHQPLRLLAGFRKCPDETCQTLVFFVSDTRNILVSYPAERIDFDSREIPSKVLSAFEEAITCHASKAFTAAAIMVRKTLEELCSERQAKGSNLKERISALSNKVLLPAELLAGLDDLRLLGNDAAHIESKEYDKVGQEEVETGIEFTKEVLKAVYQYASLLAKLRGLKRTPATPGAGNP